MQEAGIVKRTERRPEPAGRDAGLPRAMLSPGDGDCGCASAPKRVSADVRFPVSPSWLPSEAAPSPHLPLLLLLSGITSPINYLPPSP